jgi:excisionase family DNA binding protein
MNDYLTAAEVAQLLRVSKPSVVALVKRQGLPAVRVGRFWRFARVDVEAWLSKQKEAGHGGRAA